MAQIGNLSVKLGLVTVDFDKAVDGSKQKAKALQDSFNKLGAGVADLNSLWKQMGGSLAVGSVGMAALIAQTTAFADKMQDLADGMGISTGFALQFSDALQKAGLSGDAATKILGKLYDNIDAARQGNQAQIDQFRKLGITFTEIKELKPEDAIKRVVASLADLQAKDPVAYVAQLRKELGKGGLGLDAEQLNAILEGGIGKWEQYGENIKKVSKIKDQLQASLNNLTIAFSKFIAPFAHEGTVSVEKFTGALAGMATFFVASKVITYTAALTEFVVALRAATAAGAAFNLMANGSPLMLALKLAAAGTAFLIYQKESGQSIERVGEQNYAPSGDVASTESDNPLLPSTGGRAKSGQESGGATSTVAKDEKSPQEIAASIALETAKIKTMNASLRNSVELWDTYKQSVVDATTAQSDQLADINAKRAELKVQYKDSETLLGLELGKLQEQEKQIRSNTSRTLQKLKYQKEIADLTQEQARQEGYYLGAVKMSEQATKNRLEQAKFVLAMQQMEIDNETELNRLRIEGNAGVGDFARSIQIQALESQTKISKLRKEMEALPEYIDMPDEMLSEEARANNQKIDFIRTQIAFEEQRHSLKVANLESERTMEFGLNRAIANYVENSSNMAKVAEDSFNSVTQNMSSALDKFVRTGKLSFKDLTKSIIQDLISIQLRASASNLFGMLASSLFGGGKTPYQPAAVMGMPGYANGGEPDVNKPSIVGERGPELFVPKTAGTIIPNNTLSKMNGGTTNITNNYINAIDTKSFEQRLLSSPNAIWAANKYGEKNLATNYGRT